MSETPWATYMSIVGWAGKCSAELRPQLQREMTMMDPGTLYIHGATVHMTPPLDGVPRALTLFQR